MSICCQWPGTKVLTKLYNWLMSLPRPNMASLFWQTSLKRYQYSVGSWTTNCLIMMSFMEVGQFLSKVIVKNWLAETCTTRLLFKAFQGLISAASLWKNGNVSQRLMKSVTNGKENLKNKIVVVHEFRRELLILSWFEKRPWRNESERSPGAFQKLTSSRAVLKICSLLARKASSSDGE